MADFLKALARGAEKRGNNNNENNIGNTTNIRVVNLPQMTEANFIRSQRITEGYEKKDRELQRINQRLAQCQNIIINRPKEIKENQELINALSQKASMSNRNQTDLNKLIAENIKLHTDIKGCHLETAGLLDKKKQLETKLFYMEKWYDEEQSLAAFNIPNRKAATFRAPQPTSMVGGRTRTRRPRRQTRKK
jgi:hypothetical protein